MEILDLGLAVIWEMLRHQWDYITEHQLELWAFLIRLRYANNEQVSNPIALHYVYRTNACRRYYKELTQFATH